MTDTQPAALAADHPERNLEMVGRWYMMDKIGMAMLCSNRADAEQEAKDATLCYPHMAPHRAVQLVEASFDAADMATAAADGYRASAAEVAKLRGQRMVLCSLLRECLGHLEDAAHAMYTLEEEMPVRYLVERIELTLTAIAEDQVKRGES